MSLYKGTTPISNIPVVDQSVIESSPNPVSGGAVYKETNRLAKSFNGRTGTVTPQSGDYTAAQAGADASGTASSAVSTHNSSASAHSSLFATKNQVVGEGVNLLDNWYFVGGGSQQGGGQFPINQKGNTSYSGAGYGIDRWTTVSDGNVLQLQSDGITVSESLFQELENPSQWAGKTLTVSALSGDGLLKVTGTIPDPLPSSANYVYYNLGNSRITLRWISSSIRVYVAKVSTATASPKFSAVKLELGDTQTLARQVNGSWVLNDPPPNFAKELAKCQRYMLSLRPWYDNTNGYLRVGGAYATGYGNLYIVVPVPVTMRLMEPEVLVNGNWMLTDGSSSTISVTNANIVKDNAASNTVKINVSSSSLTVPRYYDLESNNDTTANIILDANL